MKYHSPRTLAEALALLGDDGLRVIAGGTDLYAGPHRPAGRGWVDVRKLEVLRGVDAKEGWTRVGAATTWTELQRTGQPIPSVLLQAAQQIGSPQIQNQGTVGGNICNAAAAADGIPALLCLGARVRLHSARGARDIALADFFKGARQTVLSADELLTEVRFPSLSAAEGSAFYKAGNRRAVTIAVISASVKLKWSAEGRITDAAVAIGAASTVPMRVRSMEQHLLGQSLGSAVDVRSPMPELYPINDIRASDTYRAYLAGVAVRRACATVAQGAGYDQAD